MTVRLVVRGLPVSGTESLQGYLLRLAQANGYRGLAAFRTVAAVPSSIGTKPFDLARLSRMTEVAEAGLSAIACWPTRPGSARTTFGPRATVLKADRSLGLAKVCRTCLAETGLLARLWDLRAVVACPRHGTLLRARCDACSRTLTWTRPGMFACACGTDLRQGSDDAAPEAAVAVARALDALHAGAGPDAPGGTLDLAAAARLVWFCGTHPPDAAGRRSRFLSRGDFHMAVQAVVAGAGPLLDWPTGLHGWISGRVGPSRDMTGQALHDLLASVATAFPDGTDVAAMGEFRQWFSGRWEGPPPRWNSAMRGTRPAHGLLPVATVARNAGANQKRLRGLVTGGRLPARRIAAGRRTITLIDPGDAEAALSVPVAGPVTGKQQARALGIGRSMRRRLYRLGLLAAAPLPGGPASVGALQAGAALEARIAAVASAAGPPPDAVSFVDLAARRQVASAEVLARALSGSLPIWLVAGGGPLLHRVLVRPSDAAVPDGSAATMSVREAAAALGVSVRMVPVLLGAGCLQGVAGKPGVPAARRSLGAAGVRAFSCHYALTRDVAARLGTSSRNAIASLERAGCVPVVRSDSAKGISAVWLASDARNVWKAG